ncbi:MAG: hypothetical protein JWO77_2781 [Ilumatobacteraceae bacterium]|nr:hypothetical protein [Ilumatobacteraceae bacterium]
MRDDLPTSFDRRAGAGLCFDAGFGRLSLGSTSIALPADAGNRVVLDAYVTLAARCRGDRIADLVEVRQDDIDALALALDLGADDLAQQVQDVLGATGEQAVRFVTRLWENRLVGGMAKVAAGVVVSGSLLAGAGAVAAAARAETGPAVTPAAVATTAAPGSTASAGDPATTTTTDMTAAGGWQDDTEPVIDGPLTTTPDGVGLIPPITEEADGTVLVPPATTDRQDPAAP